jgi:hypothetical protein
MGGSCGTHGERRNGYKTLLGKPEGKRGNLNDLGVGGSAIMKWFLYK